MGLKQREAADLLGLKKRVIQYYEQGERDGKPVDIPKSVALACYAITAGVESYDGAITATPRKPASDAAKRPRSRKAKAATAG